MTIMPLQTNQRTGQQTNQQTHSLLDLRSDIQQDFPLLEKKRNGKPFVYADNSATTQKPRVVLEAMDYYYQNQNANVHRGIYRLAQQATMAYEQAHETVAQFIGAEMEEVIFTKGTTESLNFLASSLGKKLQPGQEILLTEMEHHSNIVPWQQLAKEKGLVVRYIPIQANGALDLFAAKQMITEKTAIVSLCHISNVLGTINPITEIVALAHQVQALVIVDAAQSVPHLPINVRELGADFLVFSGHKMLGPTGIGVLWGKKSLLEMLEPYQYGGDMIKEVTFAGATWNDLPWKFEAGTPPIAEAIGLAAAIGYLQKIGMDMVWKQGQMLVGYAWEKLSAVPGIHLLGPEPILYSSVSHDQMSRGQVLHGPVISFTLDGIHPHDISEILDRENIAVRAGYHCAMPLHQKLGLNGSTRLSLYIYNTIEEIDAVVTALHHVREVFQ